MAAQMIIIEGLIGIGKTTLTDDLGKQLNYRVIHEPVEENPYLEKFYESPKRYALEMQFWLMSRRFAMHTEAVEHIWRTGQGVIMDRSIYGDAVFAKKNYLDENIDKIGYENYLCMRNAMFRYLMVPHTCLYLHAPSKVCQQRIQQRSRNCESAIPLEYLDGLDVVYKELLTELHERGTKVLQVDWTSFGETKDVIELLRQKTGLASHPFVDYPEINDSLLGLKKNKAKSAGQQNFWQ